MKALKQGKYSLQTKVTQCLVGSHSIDYVVEVFRVYALTDVEIFSRPFERISLLMATLLY